MNNSDFVNASNFANARPLQIGVHHADSTNSATITPIAKLKKGSRYVTIQGLVMTKTVPRSFLSDAQPAKFGRPAKPAQVTKVFNVILHDDTSEITATFFDDLDGPKYKLMEEGKSYMLKNCSIQAMKRDGKENDALGHPCEGVIRIYLERGQQLKHFITKLDGVTFDPVIYRFCPLNEIKDKDVDSVHDIVGVLRVIGRLGNIRRETGLTFKFREIELVDETGALSFTMYGSNAEKLDNIKDVSKVMAIRGAKVEQVGGDNSVKVKILEAGIVEINPQRFLCPQTNRFIDKTVTLTRWYQLQKNTSN